MKGGRQKSGWEWWNPPLLCLANWLTDEFSAGGKFLTATLPPAYLSVGLSILSWSDTGFSHLFPSYIVQHCHQKRTLLRQLVHFHISTKLFTWVVKLSLINDAPWTLCYNVKSVTVLPYAPPLYVMLPLLRLSALIAQTCFRVLLLWLCRRLAWDSRACTKMVYLETTDH